MLANVTDGEVAEDGEDSSRVCCSIDGGECEPLPLIFFFFLLLPSLWDATPVHGKDSCLMLIGTRLTE